MLTSEKVLVSMPEALAAAARRKSKETGVSLSSVVQRALARWVATGEIAPAVEAEKTWPTAAPSKGGPTKQKKLK